jgi:hypothetical protein
MKNIFKDVDGQPEKRRYNSTEFLVGVGSLIPVMAFGWFADIRLSALAVCLIVNAYIISRTAMKLNRESLRGWGGKTTELKALVIAQVLVMASFFLNLPSSWIVSLLSSNAAIYLVCRGLVKKTPYKIRHQVINI